LARGAHVAYKKINAGSDRPFYAQKVATAGFYCEQILPRCLAGEQAVLSSAGAIVDYPVDWI
jgi:hypothetical protein